MTETFKEIVSQDLSVNLARERPWLWLPAGMLKGNQLYPLWWCTPLILALSRQRQVDLSEDGVAYRASSRQPGLLNRESLSWKIKPNQNNNKTQLKSQLDLGTVVHTFHLSTLVSPAWSTKKLPRQGHTERHCLKRKRNKQNIQLELWRTKQKTPTGADSRQVWRQKRKMN